MPVTFTDICVDELAPMRAVYQRTKVTPEYVAKARAEALQAETERLVKVKGVIGEENLPCNVVLAGIGLQETLLVHRTVDHRTGAGGGERHRRGDGPQALQEA